MVRSLALYTTVSSSRNKAAPYYLRRWRRWCGCGEAIAGGRHRRRSVVVVVVVVVGATGHLLGQGPELLAGDADTVGRFDEDLLHDVSTPEADVGREPGGGVVRSLVLVHVPVDRDEVRRVIRECERRRGGPARAALAPGVGESDDVVDLHGGARARSAREGDEVPAVGIVQASGDDQARLQRIVDDVGQPGGQQVVAGVAAVAVDVEPGLAEELAAVAVQGCRFDDHEPGERGGRLGDAAGRHGERRGCAHLGPPLWQDRREGDHEDEQDDGGHRRPRPRLLHVVELHAATMRRRVGRRPGEILWLCTGRRPPVPVDALPAGPASRAGAAPVRPIPATATFGPATPRSPRRARRSAGPCAGRRGRSAPG